MEKEPYRVEVVDFSGEEFNKRSVPCSVGLLIMLTVALINIFLMVFFPGTYISLYVSLIWGICIILFFYINTKSWKN